MAETNIQVNVFDKLVRELYLDASPSRLDQAVSSAVETLRHAPKRLSQLLSDYRTDLSSLPKPPTAPAGQAWANPQPLFNQRATLDRKTKAKLNQIIADVEAAAGQITKSVGDVRAAYRLGPGQKGDTNAIPILARAAELEQELQSGTPRLQEAINIVSEALGTKEGGEEMALPGWTETDQVHPTVGPIVEVPEKPWYMQMGGSQSYERMRNKTILDS